MSFPANFISGDKSRRRVNRTLASLGFISFVILLLALAFGSVDRAEATATHSQPGQWQAGGEIAVTVSDTATTAPGPAWQRVDSLGETSEVFSGDFSVGILIEGSQQL